MSKHKDTELEYKGAEDKRAFREEKIRRASNGTSSEDIKLINQFLIVLLLYYKNLNKLNNRKIKQIWKELIPLHQINLIN